MQKMRANTIQFLIFLCFLPIEKDFPMLYLKLVPWKFHITTDTLGCIDSVIDGVTGLICKTGDCKTLSDLMFKLYADPVLRKKLGKQAREHVIKHTILNHM